MLRHLKMLAELRGEVHAARLFRKYVSGYTRGLPGSAGFRSRVNQTGTSREIEDLIGRYFDTLRRWPEETRPLCKGGWVG